MLSPSSTETSRYNCLMCGQIAFMLAVEYDPSLMELRAAIYAIMGVATQLESLVFTDPASGDAFKILITEEYRSSTEIHGKHGAFRVAQFVPAPKES